jgi:hypothetical protein
MRIPSRFEGDILAPFSAAIKRGILIDAMVLMPQHLLSRLSYLKAHRALFRRAGEQSNLGPTFLAIANYYYIYYIISY